MKLQLRWISTNPMLTCSRYLHLIPCGGRAIAFNALTGGMVSMQTDVANSLSSDSSLDLEAISTRYPELLFIGAIIDKSIDERDFVSVRLNRARYSQRWLEITLVPSLACNMRCIYCNQPEEARTRIMSSEIAENVLKYIEKQIDSYEGLSITWYGGEPLLFLDRVLSMQDSIVSMCSRQGVSLFASIITNGLLLNVSNAKRIARSGIRQAQVTLDGPPEAHDHRRPTRTGKGTFKRILKNVLAVREFIHVRLRVNLDNSNAACFNALLNILRDNDLIENVYVAPVVGENTPCAATKTPFMSGSDFGSVIALEANKLSHDIETVRLTPSPLPCTAPCEASYVFGPIGHVYRCWHELGHSNLAFDHVMEGKASPNRYLFWLNYDPLSHPECADCNVLPLCLGGCPDLRIKGIEPPMCCSPIRSHLHEFVRNYASHSILVK